MDGSLSVPAAVGRSGALLALVIFCCIGLEGNAFALSGRGGGYQNPQHLRQLKTEARVRQLDKLLALSVAQKAQLNTALQRSTDKNAGLQIRALLTDQQRRIYNHAPKTAQE